MCTFDGRAETQTLRGYRLAATNMTTVPWASARPGPVVRDPVGCCRVAIPGLPSVVPFTFVALTAARPGNNGTIRSVVSMQDVASTTIGVGWGSTNGTPVGQMGGAFPTGTALGHNVWASLAFTNASSTDHRLFVNGLQVASDSTLGVPLTPTQFVLGDLPNGTSFFDIAYGLLYTRILSASELQWLAIEPFAFMSTPLRRSVKQSAAQAAETVAWITFSNTSRIRRAWRM